MSAKQIFQDIAKEMESKCLTETFEVQGHSYEMKLLNGEETNWRNAHVMLNGKFTEEGMTSINLAALSAVKLPTLAIGIRKIDGVPVKEAFKEDWGDLDDKVKLNLLGDNKFAKKWFIAENFMQYLSSWIDDSLEELWGKWDELQKRRVEAAETLKKSSGEASTENIENSTEPSPSGDQQ
jgi:hypothetical protein